MKPILFLILGFSIGLLSLFFHPQFSYYGVEFLRSQSPASLSVLDYPNPYGLLKQERHSEAKLATQLFLQKKSASHLEIEKYHFQKTFSQINKNFKAWSIFSIHKLGLFFGFIEINNPILLFQNKAFSYFVGILSALSFLSLCFLISNNFIQFSWGCVLAYFIFYSSSSLRLFLIPLYFVLSYLLLKKLYSLIMMKRWIKATVLILPMAISIIIIRIPYFFPFYYSPKSFHRIHVANGYYVKGKTYIEQNKKYFALEEFLQGLNKHWSYHSSIRVELAKIYLEEKDFGRALNFLRNPRDNPYAHELLGKIFLLYPKTSHPLAEKNFQKAIELRPFEPRFYDELATFYQREGRLDEAKQLLDKIKF